MGSRMPDSPVIPRMDKTLHPFLQKIIEKKKKNIPAFFEKTNGCFPQKNKDQNDRNAKIYRFKTSNDKLSLKTRVISRNRKKQFNIHPHF